MIFFFRKSPPSRKALFINILYIQLIVLKNDKGIVVGRGYGDTFGRQRNRPKRNGRQNCPKQKISRCNSATWRQTHLFHRDGSKKTTFRENALRAVGVKNPFRAAYGGPRWQSLTTRRKFPAAETRKHIERGNIYYSIRRLDDGRKGSDGFAKRIEKSSGAFL